MTVQELIEALSHLDGSAPVRVAGFGDVTVHQAGDGEVVLSSDELWAELDRAEQAERDADFQDY